MRGIGSMLHALTGGSANDPSKYIGRTVETAKMEDERLVLGLDGGQEIEIWDDGQSCCENRYMTTDDEVGSLVGGKLLGIEAKDGPTEEEDYEVHETVFVEIRTDRGFITLTNHNEHNGYYGGFGLTVTEKGTRED